MLEAIEEYNRYRAPEAKAELISFNGASFKVRFIGSFCYTCGFYDYLEDLKIILEEKGVNVEIRRVEEIEGRSYRSIYILIFKT